MAFTWFANVFDTDDVPYRLLMIVMIAGSLGLAAGVPQIAHLDFRMGVLSYVVMRLAYVGQWLRVWLTAQPLWRPVAAKIIVLTTINQIGWVLFLWVPAEWKLQIFVAWFAADLATPYVAGWDARMGGHRHHIVERYGLFTIIVLGETVAASTIAVGEAIESHAEALPLLLLAIGGLITVSSLWWIYFDFSTARPRQGLAIPLGLPPLLHVCRHCRDRSRSGIGCLVDDGS
jgi:low temperature requirement protein LtrA